MQSWHVFVAPELTKSEQAMFDPPPAAHTAEVSKGHGSAWRGAPVGGAGDPQFGGQNPPKSAEMLSQMPSS